MRTTPRDRWVRVSSPRPTIEELRKVAQPESVLGRVSGEHWAGKLYQRHISIHLTRWVAPTRVSPNGLTWLMLFMGIGAAAVLTIPHWWAALVTVLLIQAQGIVDCMDGELARWRQHTGPVGIYVDRLGHYVTDGGLAIAVGVHADGGLGSMHGWTTVGLATGFLVLLTKAETDLVHVARAQSGRERVVDTAEAAASHRSLLRRLRSMAGSLPINRALLALELSVLALVSAIVDAVHGGLSATRVLDVALLVIAGIVVVGHLLATVTSDRLR
jgi:phosphatidylglycerophosphate synthase